MGESQLAFEVEMANLWYGSFVYGPDGYVEVTGRPFGEDLLLGWVDANGVRVARRFSRRYLDEALSIAERELTRIRGARS